MHEGHLKFQSNGRVISATVRVLCQVPVVQLACVWVNAMLRIDPADHKGIAKRRGRDARVRHKAGACAFRHLLGGRSMC